jgi:hypothetical protein
MPAAAKVLPPGIAAAVGATLASDVVDARRPTCGLSAAERWIVRLRDGRTVFVKAAVDDATEGWLRTEAAVLADRAAFIGLGVCSRAWLDDVSHALVEVDESVDPSGDRLVHGDVRSDNIGLGGERVVFVDWSNARRGDPRHDLAELLPYLHLEGAPPPFSFARLAGGAARLAGARVSAHSSGRRRTGVKAGSSARRGPPGLLACAWSSAMLAGTSSSRRGIGTSGSASGRPKSSQWIGMTSRAPTASTTSAR